MGPHTGSPAPAAPLAAYQPAQHSRQEDPHRDRNSVELLQEVDGLLKL